MFSQFASLDLDLAYEPMPKATYEAIRRQLGRFAVANNRNLDAALDKWPVTTSCAADVQADL